MERSDLTRDVHQIALTEYLEAPQAVRSVKADFFKFGIVMSLYSPDVSGQTFSRVISPHEARVIAMEILSAADSCEALPYEEDPI